MTSSYYLSSAPSGHRRKSGLRKRCLLMVKQQKTRFYILGRCVSMLLCWHDHSISD
ncbi:small polypeptide DEVIL 10 [Humulus lupulus]|uniref:small polypeptide DEVIL 10 n=1 Tax=Humulus lupulus TaxID=3486 RepID=UPI002B41477E|nr:small polypeptide DEVIL 10 [Humulus lupulus]